MTPAASAMSRTVVASKPRWANSVRAASRIWPRRWVRWAAPARPSAAGPRRRCEPAWTGPRRRRPSGQAVEQQGQDAVRHLVRLGRVVPGQPDMGDGPVEHVPQDPAVDRGLDHLVGHGRAEQAPPVPVHAGGLGADHRPQAGAGRAGRVEHADLQRGLVPPGHVGDLVREPADRGQRVARVGRDSRTTRTRSAWYSSTSSTAMASLDSKWWYRLPGRIPEAAATSRIDVLAYPSSANSPAAARRISSRRLFRPPSGVLGTEDGDTVTRPLCGRRRPYARIWLERGGLDSAQSGSFRWSCLASTV